MENSKNHPKNNSNMKKASYHLEPIDEIMMKGMIAVMIMIRVANLTMIMKNKKTDIESEQNLVIFSYVYSSVICTLSRRDIFIKID